MGQSQTEDLAAVLVALFANDQEQLLDQMSKAASK
jgi:hypothetical protein